MRKIIFLLVLLLQVSMLFSQTETKQTSAKDEYLTKSKSRKKTANILLIGGGGLLVAGAVFPKGAMDSPPPGSFIYFTSYKNDGLRAGLIISGLLSMLTSVPFYLSAGSNRHKANAITLNIDNGELLFGTFVLIKQPAVTFKLTL